MKSDYFKNVILSSFVFLLTLSLSCSGRAGKGGGIVVSGKPADSGIRAEGLVKMNSPAMDAECKLNDKVKVSLSPEAENSKVDSVKIFFDGKEITVLKSAPWEYSIPSSFISATGRKPVRAVAYGRGLVGNVTHFVIVYSDVVPKKFGYRVVHSYPHDKEAFTQGLFYDNGVLYEGTGQEAGSSLREVELGTGKVLRQHNLDPSLFGEGITLFKGRIYQVTWRNKVGFVYDKSNFTQINKIFYQTEGWGLTTMNDRIVMSDGSNILYFIEPETFTVASRLEVYDNRKKIDQLNELEYINGEIWANIWQTDLIARIDPSSGKVKSYVNLSGIFPESERKKTDADVLNGIAFDAGSGRIFVTGKRWPELYEITVTE
jgi:glutaminyl-peptide cyclotransferase